MSVNIPPGWGVCAWGFECLGRPRNYAITCGFQPASSGGDPNDFAAALDAAFTLTGAPAGDPANMLSTYRYLGTTVTYMTDTGPLPGAHSHVVSGTAGAGGMPPNAAYLVRKVTGRGGRQGRGRMYVPPFNMSELGVNSAGIIDPSVITALTAQFLAWRAGAATGGVPLYLLHGDNKAGTIDAPDVITDVFVEAQVATQRRRLRK